MISPKLRSIECRSNCAQKYPQLLLHGKSRTRKPFGDSKLFKHEIICRPFSGLQMNSLLYPARMACWLKELLLPFSWNCRKPIKQLGSLNAVFKSREMILPGPALHSLIATKINGFENGKQIHHSPFTQGDIWAEDRVTSSNTFRFLLLPESFYWIQISLVKKIHW